MSYNINITRVRKDGKTVRETYTNTTRDVAEFMLSDVKNRAPKAPAYVRVEVLSNGELVQSYDSRMGVTIDMED